MFQYQISLKNIRTKSLPMQQCAAVKTKYRWITVPPQRLARSISSVKNSRRTSHSHDCWTASPLTTLRFLFLIIFEFSSIEQYCRSKEWPNRLINGQKLKPFSKVSEIGWKHGLLSFEHFFSSYSNPSHPYCSEQTRRLKDKHVPVHSVHWDQLA